MPTDFHKRALAIEDAYRDAMNQLGRDIRSELIIPFCNRKAMRFTAGMGLWSFDDGGNKVLSDWTGDDLRKSHHLGARLYDALTLPWGLATTQDLGAMIQGYTPPGYRRS